MLLSKKQSLFYSNRTGKVVWRLSQSWVLLLHAQYCSGKEERRLPWATRKPARSNLERGGIFIYEESTILIFYKTASPSHLVCLNKHCILPEWVICLLSVGVVADELSPQFLSTVSRLLALDFSAGRSQENMSSFILGLCLYSLLLEGNPSGPEGYVAKSGGNGLHSSQPYILLRTKKD